MMSQREERSVGKVAGLDARSASLSVDIIFPRRLLRLPIVGVEVPRRLPLILQKRRINLVSNQVLFEKVQAKLTPSRPSLAQGRQ